MGLLLEARPPIRAHFLCAMSCPSCRRVGDEIACHSANHVRSHFGSIRIASKNFASSQLSIMVMKLLILSLITLVCNAASLIANDDDESDESSFMQNYWEEYYLSRRDQGPQVNWLDLPDCLVNTEVMQTGTHAGLRRCRLCSSPCPGILCLACRFHYCINCLQQDYQMCMCADCVSSFQPACLRSDEAWLQTMAQQTPESFGITHNFQKPAEAQLSNAAEVIPLHDGPLHAMPARPPPGAPGAGPSGEGPAEVCADNANPSSEQGSAPNAPDPWKNYFQQLRNRGSSGSQGASGSGLHRPDKSGHDATALFQLHTSIQLQTE